MANNALDALEDVVVLAWRALVHWYRVRVSDNPPVGKGGYSIKPRCDVIDIGEYKAANPAVKFRGRIFPRPTQEQRAASRRALDEMAIRAREYNG